MKIVFCIFIILLNYKLLYLFPWSHVEGKFNTADLTILFIGVWVIYLLIFNIKVFFNKYAVFIIVLMIWVSFHVPYAMLKYSVTFKDAAIASRIFLLYFSYFMFLDIFKDEAAIRQLFKGLTLVAAVAIVAGLVDYIGLDILYHRWATEEGHRMRGGIVRAFFPAYWLIVFVSLYALSDFLNNERYSHYSIPFIILSLATIAFRQTRMIIGGYGLVAGFNLARRMRSKKVWLFLAMGALGFVILLINLDRVIIIDKMIQKTETELVESTGSWGGRVEQLKTTWDLVGQNFLAGAATSALRTNIEAYKKFSPQRAKELVRYSMNSDLGYAIWIKNFGLLGVVYLLLLARTAYKDYQFIQQRQTATGLVDFTGNYLLYIAITFFTLNHLGKSEGIILFTLTLAMLQSLSSTLNSENAHAKQ